MITTEKKETIIQHLQELRRVLIITILTILLGMICCYFFMREPLMAIVFGPVRALGKEVVIISVVEGFWIQLKLAFIGGIIVASPVLFWQIISFILPALYQHEKKVFFVYLSVSLLLFLFGIILVYIFISEYGLHAFLIDYARGFTTMISASKYVSFFLSFIIPFGLIFQIPIATIFLSRLGIITPAFLRRKRGYAIIAIFIIAAVLTPPDVLSQIILALPMFLLYEISILLSVFVCRRKRLKQ
jgi:sec-independent protein translocase protein TatC